jgi:hypothetical protein
LRYVFKQLKIKTKYKHPSHVGLEIKTLPTFRSHAVYLLSFSIDQSFKRLSKLVRVTGTLENLNLAVNLIFVLQKYGVVANFFVSYILSNIII